MIAKISNDVPGVTIDSGGGTLRWTVWRGENEICGGELPGANPQLLGWDRYFKRLGDTVHLALSQANVRLNELQVLGMGLSGVDRPDEIEGIYVWVRQAFPSVTACWAGNDALPALRAGAGALRGILLVAGTGSICIAATSKAPGQWIRARTGGWGTLLGDEGSGYWLGLQLLRETCRCADGRSQKKNIMQRVLHHFDVQDAQQLIPLISKMDAAQQRMAIAELAPLTRELAENGDPFAGNLMQSAAQHLADLAIVCANRLNSACPPESLPYPLFLHGALLRQWPALAERVGALIGNDFPEMPISLQNVSPMNGAFALASEEPFSII